MFKFEKVIFMTKRNSFYLCFIIYFDKTCSNNELKPITFLKEEYFLITYTNERQETNSMLPLAIMKVTEKQWT